MGTACEMRTLSSLELMLLNLRKAEEEPPEVSPPPALPARPVVKLRPRKKQPFMSGKSQFRQEHQVEEKRDAFLDSIPQMESSEEGYRPIDYNEDVEEKERKNLLKGVMVIQRSYRGHQAYNYYHELKRGAITLQSCIRGWFARRAFAKQVANQVANKAEVIKVPQTVLLDLGRKVLMAEAALERKKGENASLKKLVADHEMKWKEYEVKMQCTEKMWQNRLTSIQTRVTESNKRRHAAGAGEHGSSRLSKTTSERIELKTRADTHCSEIKSEQEVSRFNPKDELAKLKLKFKAWVKDYRNRLQEAKTTMKKLGQPAKGKSSKIWCGR